MPLQSSARVTSARYTEHCPPSSVIACLVSSAASRLKSTTITAAPSIAYRIATALPLPIAGRSGAPATEPAPVTIATFPFSLSPMTSPPNQFCREAPAGSLDPFLVLFNKVFHRFFQGIAHMPAPLLFCRVACNDPRNGGKPHCRVRGRFEADLCIRVVFHRFVEYVLGGRGRQDLSHVVP